jgi:hypothetical protein
MQGPIQLPDCDARILRREILLLQKFKKQFLKKADFETAERIMASSNRFSELLRFMKRELPYTWRARLKKMLRQARKRFRPFCEVETNIRLVNEFHNQGRMDSIALELLLNAQNIARREKGKLAQRFLTKRRFRELEILLSQLKESGNASQAHDDVFKKRADRFMKFRWNADLGDKRLLHLSTRAKDLGCTIDVREIITCRPQLRLRKHVRNLEKLLCRIHDLVVFQRMVRQLKRDWDIRELNLVPSLLKQLSLNIRQEKLSQYRFVYPLFAKIVPLLTTTTIPKRKPVQTSYSVNDQKVPSGPSIARTVRSPRNTKRSA